MQNQRTYSISSLLLIVTVPALGSLLFGYDIGATSFVVAKMKESEQGWIQQVGRDSALQGLLVSLCSVGAFLGSIWIFMVGDDFGRRQELRLSACLYAMGTALEATSIDMTHGLFVYAAGRLIYGIAIGAVMHSAPTYIVEQCPSELRGFLVSCKEVAIMLGILLGYVVGNLCTLGDTPRLPFVYITSLILSFAMGILSLFIPRSCRWLLLKDYREEALESISFVWGREHAEEKLMAMNETIEKYQQELTHQERRRHYKFLWEPRYKTAVIAGYGLVMLQQMTGQPSVLAFATPIFQEIGLSKHSVFVVAISKTAATAYASILVEQKGRKALLYVGISCMLCALIALSVLIGYSSSIITSYLILVAMLLYIAGYQFSFGPITWLIVSEIFPSNVRGKAVAFSVQLNFLFYAIVQFVVPVLSSWIGLNWTFAGFGLISAYRYDFACALRRNKIL